MLGVCVYGGDWRINTNGICLVYTKMVLPNLTYDFAVFPSLLFHAFSKIFWFLLSLLRMSFK